MVYDMKSNNQPRKFKSKESIAYKTNTLHIDFKVLFSNNNDDDDDNGDEDMASLI